MCSLLVFDNVNDPAAIERYLPVPAAGAHILVTSRAEQHGFDPIALDVLDSTQSLELLIQEAGRVPAGDDECAAAQAIAARLAGLPLALEIAGAYLRHRAPLPCYPHYHRGRYRESREWLETAERYHRETPAGDDLDALLASDIGALERALGNPRRALEYYQRALALHRQREGDGHASTALSLRNVAIAYRELGDYKAALELGERALTMSLAAQGPRHRAIAAALGELGLTHADLGDYRKALDFQSRACQLNRSSWERFIPASVRFSITSAPRAPTSAITRPR